MPETLPMPEMVYKPLFDVPENIAPDIAGKRQGERFKAILNYAVVEKTRSYVVLRVDSIYLRPARRVF